MCVFFFFGAVVVWSAFYAVGFGSALLSYDHTLHHLRATTQISGIFKDWSDVHLHVPQLEGCTGVLVTDERAERNHGCHGESHGRKVAKDIL